MRNVVKPLLLLGLTMTVTACTSSEPPADLNPGKALRAAYAASMQVYGAQLSQMQNVRGGLPQGDGVQVLVEQGIKVVPATDAWGNEIRYHNDGTHWTLSSAGPDLEWGSRDDIVIEDGQLK